MRRQGCWIGGRFRPGREQSPGWADRPGGHPHEGGLPVEGYCLLRGRRNSEKISAGCAESRL